MWELRLASAGQPLARSASFSTLAAESLGTLLILLLLRYVSPMLARHVSVSTCRVLDSNDKDFRERHRSTA